MLSKSLKIIAVGASFAGLVACGKGVGQKNNLKIDGTYAEVKTAKVDASGKTIDQSNVSRFVEIKDNVSTEYLVNEKEGLVSIKRANLIVRGKNIDGAEIIQDSCDETAVGLIEELDIKVEKVSGGLKLADAHKSTTVLAEINKKEIEAIKEAIKTDDETKRLNIVCMDETGKVIGEATNATKVVEQKNTADTTKDIEAKELSAEDKNIEKSESAQKSDDNNKEASAEVKEEKGQIGPQ